MNAVSTGHSRAGYLTAYVGCYSDPSAPDSGGGIAAVQVSNSGDDLTLLGHAAEPQEAGYLVFAAGTRTLYAVDERKTDGRGPVHSAAAVHALAAGSDGTLKWLNSQPAPCAFPTFLDVDESRCYLVAASHGGFDHVERVVRNDDGEWEVQYHYDDSAALLYRLEDDGTIGPVQDVQVMTGHGKDPNFSPQAGGHGQASAHAHCAVIDPSRRYVLVADKGTDQIHVYSPGHILDHVHTFHFPVETGPRHIAFDASGIAYVTLEFASELASMNFDTDTGTLELIDRVSTVAADFQGLNEPADVRVHPHGRFVYVNNRGEDSVAWFEIGADRHLTRRGHVDIARSSHPGLAARSFAFDPTGSFLLLADRPANLVRSYRVDKGTGTLTPLSEIAIAQPAFIALVEPES